VQDRGNELAAQTSTVLREREQLAALAEERRAAMRALESRVLQERQRLDAQAKAERLRQIALMEDQYACVSPACHA
jgi:predicted  nucleic acid-binding Zn-ribbon protein